MRSVAPTLGTCILIAALTVDGNVWADRHLAAVQPPNPPEISVDLPHSAGNPLSPFRMRFAQRLGLLSKAGKLDEEGTKKLVSQHLWNKRIRGFELVEVGLNIADQMTEADEMISKGLREDDVESFQSAFAVLEQMHKNNPDNFKVVEKLAWLCLYKLNEREKGLGYAQKLTSLAPNDLLAKELFAYALSETGRFRKAIPLYREVLSADPEFDEWMALNLAKSLIEIGSFRAAVAEYENILTNVPDYDPAKTALEKYFAGTKAETREHYISLLERSLQIVKSSGVNKDYHAAAMYLMQAKLLNPNNHFVLKTLGWIHIEHLRDPVQAYDVLKDAYVLQPSDIETKKLLAYALSETGRFRKAIPLYREVLSADPEFDEWMALNLAKSLIEIGSFREAVAEYENILTNDPKYAPAKAALETYFAGLATENRQLYVSLLEGALQILKSTEDDADYRRAAKYLERALRLNPDNHYLLKTLGWINVEHLYNAKGAYQHLIYAHRLKPNDLETTKLLGLALYGVGEYCSAIKVFQRALADDPRDNGIRAQLGMALARTDCQCCATRQYHKVLRRDREHPGARLGLAEIAAWQGATRTPIQTCNELLTEDPEFLGAYLLLGDLHKWNWDFTSAVDSYVSALSLNSNDRSALDSLEEIRRLHAHTLSTNVYGFVDNLDFARHRYTQSGRAPLSDGVYVGGQLVYWNFELGDVINERRREQRLTLELHPFRGLEFNADFWVYDYRNHPQQEALSLSTEWQPIPDTSVFLSYTNNEPAYPDSINIPLQNIRMDQAGIGLDLPIAHSISSQLSYVKSHYSDNNRREFGSAQLSVDLDRKIVKTLRLKYEVLTYREQRIAYFSPDLFQLYGLAVDAEKTITDDLSITASAEIPYVVEETGKIGHRVAVGASYYGEHLEVTSTYTNLATPGALAFSGDVFEIGVLLYW